MRRSLALGLLALLYFENGSRAATVQVGNCSIQTVVGENANVKMENVYVNCGTPSSPKTALKINYYWLDAVSAALLIDGRPDTRLSALLGAKPILLNNDVLENLQDLQRRFGNTIGSHSLFMEHYNLFTTKISGVGGKAKEIAGTTSVYRSKQYSNLRIFDGMSPVYWPDVTAAREIATSALFPPSYKHYARIDENDFQVRSGGRPLNSEDAIRAMNAALMTRVLYKPLSREELESYKDQLEAMKASAKSADNAGLSGDFIDVDRLKPKLPEQTGDEIDDQKRNQELLRRLPELSGSKTVSALKYITREGMPNDFLAAFGVIDGHVNAPISWTLLALPRRLFLQIAVIENSATMATDYSLSEFLVSRSTETKLRTSQGASPAEDRAIYFPQGRLSHRERVVIPLAIEFRDHRQYGDEDRQIDARPDLSTFKKVKSALDRLQRDTVVAHDGENKPFELFAPKAKQQFLTHEPPASVQSSYLYGPSYTIKSVRLQDMDIPVRSAQPAGLYRVAGFDGGSCPAVYYRTRGSEEWLRLGNVLRTAMGPTRKARESYELPENTSDLLIVEEEPERSFLKDLRIYSRSLDESVRELTSAGSKFSLDYGEYRSFSVPPVSPGETIKFEVEGYYVPYSSFWLATASPPSSPQTSTP